MQVALYILIGCVIGALAVYVWLIHRINQLKISVEVAQKELSMQREQSAETLRQHEQQATQEIRLREQQNAQETQLRTQQFQEQLKVVREQFQNLASRLLDETSERLQNRNKEAMQGIVKPINDSFEQLQQTIRQSDQEQAKTVASLSERLRLMGEQTERMGQTAERLTNALRGDSKQAGDWGELVLQELLDSQGFRRGIDYDVQGTIMDGEGRVILNDDSGQRMRPDVVLHYPDQQDVVIDAKVSIKAYYDYVNETSDALKKQYLDRHVQSLRSHVRELVVKDYSKYILPPRSAVDFVIMYVPNDAALQVAFAREPRLWQEAFDQKVFISGTQNLFAILRMIQIAWRQHRQTENQQRIITLAEQLLSRIGLFAERYAKIGHDIQQLQSDYDEVQKSVSGRLSISQKANELKKLGVKEDVKHPLPQPEEE
jgi:DNA recombination protein RmuC